MPRLRNFGAITQYNVALAFTSLGDSDNERMHRKSNLRQDTMHGLQVMPTGSHPYGTMY
jgi:hypothetical protein